MDANSAERMVCIVDSHAGIYVPQEFAEREDINYWGGERINGIYWQDLLDGPDNENYWDSWSYVLDNASYTDSEGHVWTLYQDMDLFMVRDDFDWDSID